MIGDNMVLENLRDAAPSHIFKDNEDSFHMSEQALNTTQNQLKQLASILTIASIGSVDSRPVTSLILVNSVNHLIASIHNRDEVATTKNITSLMYVLEGLSAKWDLPTDETFWKAAELGGIDDVETVNVEDLIIDLRTKGTK